MMDIRSKLASSGQTHILEAFPDLKDTDKLSKQIADIDIDALIRNYKKAIDVGARSDVQCGCVDSVVLPVESLRLDDTSTNRSMNYFEIHYMFTLIIFSPPRHNVHLSIVCLHSFWHACEPNLRTRTHLSSEWELKGWEAIQNKSVGVVILSGGQGTRLGFDGPKGMYDIGLQSKKR